jgi:hypothetical protein
MFKFISPDTIISLEKIEQGLENDGWVDSTEGRLDKDFVGNKEELILKILEIGQNATDCQPLKIMLDVQDFLDSFLTDFQIHAKWVIAESAEFNNLVKWVLKGNSFLVGTVLFTRIDATDREYFLVKCFEALKISNKTTFMDDNKDGEKLFKLFYDFCKESVTIV